MNAPGKNAAWLAVVAGGLLVLSGCHQIHEARARQLVRSTQEHFANGNFDQALEVSEVAIRLGAEVPVLFWMRGRIFMMRYRAEAALEEFNRGLDAVDAAAGKGEPAAPELASELLSVRGSALEVLGRYREALESLQKAVETYEDNSGAHNNIGWILATIPLGSLRDGEKAIVHATRACELTKWKSAAFLDTLAAAHAEAGDFENAIKWQTTASEFLDENDEVNISGFESRLELYREGKPYREDPKAMFAEMMARESKPENPPEK